MRSNHRPSLLASLPTLESAGQSLSERATRAGAAVIFMMIAIAGFALLGYGSYAANAAVDATGNWNVTVSGETFATGTIKLEQVGPNVVGSYGQNGRIDGAFKPGTLQVDGTWNDSRGTGWLTIIFTADGNGFSGEWGYAGRKPSGRFVATRLVPSSPNVTGNFNVSVTGGPEFWSRHMKLHQLGQTVVGNFGEGTQIGGTMNANTLSGTWKGPRGEGWVRLGFTSDGRGFQGEWGLTSDKQARGQVIGSMVNTVQLWIRGLWDTASSGPEFAVGKLKLQQEGQTAIGTYKNGHLQGTLPKGSNTLTGRWRDAHGGGEFAFKYANDGNSFQGTWNSYGGTSGRIVGKRVIAASPALR